VGHADSWDEIYYEGKPEEQKFVAYYIKGDKIKAVAGMNTAHAIFAIQEALNQNQMPTASEIKSGKVTIPQLMKKLKVGEGGKCKRTKCCQKKGSE